jgi:hypothetical protein
MPRELLKKSNVKTGVNRSFVWRYSGWNGKTYQYQKSNHHLECKKQFRVSRRMKNAKTTKAYKLIPMSLILNLENLAKFSLAKINHRLKLYENSVGSWYRLFGMGRRKVILWDRTVADESNPYSWWDGWCFSNKVHQRVYCGKGGHRNFE